MRLRMSLGLLLALLAAPAVAHAQDDDVGAVRLGAYLALGLAGEAEAEIHPNEGRLPPSLSTSKLRPTVGFGLRADVPVHEYFVIGGLFELLTFEGVWRNERESVFDIDVWVKGRYPFEVAEEVVLEPYVGLPVGLTLGVALDPNDLDRDEVWPGFNIGVLAGLAILFKERFGGFIELGWRHHEFFNHVITSASLEPGSMPSQAQFRITANQLALHFGGMIAF